MSHSLEGTIQQTNTLLSKVAADQNSEREERKVKQPQFLETLLGVLIVCGLPSASVGGSFYYENYYYFYLHSSYEGFIGGILKPPVPKIETLTP